jgi:hypothetical protein
MNVLKNFFWNNEEVRLRTGFRIILQLTAFFVIMKSLKFIIGVPNEIAGNTPLWIFLAIAGIRLFRVLFSVWPAGRFLDHRPFANFGLRFNKGWWIDLSFGMGLGILLMGSIFLIELFAGWVSISETLHTASPGQSFILSIIVFVILFVCVGFSEELFYRGYHLTNLAEGLNFKVIGLKNSIIIAVGLSSVLFGIFHLGSPSANLVSTINIILWGVLFSLPYILTGSLAIPIGIHITWNLFQGNVFGFPISGATFPLETVTFFSIKQSGPELWTGGAFGPEAGLLNLFAFFTGILLIVGWIKYRQGNLKIYTPIAEPPEVVN